MSTRKPNQENRQHHSTNVLPKKRYHRVINDDSSDCDSDIQILQEKPEVESLIQSKRQKKSGVSGGFAGLGADISSPEKLASTRQSEEEDEQHHHKLNSTAKSSNQVMDSRQSTPEKKEDGKFEGSAISHYLNEENLKHLQRISECVKLDFRPFIQQMILDENKDNESNIELFKKKETHLNIGALQTRGTQHIQRNKLSDKFSRRDVQFYDLYVKKENGEDLAQLQDNQFPLDIDAEMAYEELEVTDFNHLFADHNLIQEKFGQTIKVELQFNPKANKNFRSLVQRKVKEYPELVKVSQSDSRRHTDSSRQRASPESHKDPELINIHNQLKNLEKQFGKTKEEIADIFTRVSGRLNKMKDYLENRPVIEWTYLEDLALAKPDDSPEFQVLLESKGWEEIMIRRDFLHATLVISDEEEKQEEQA